MIDRPGNSAQSMTKPSICQAGEGLGRFPNISKPGQEPHVRSQETCSVACGCVPLASSGPSLGLKWKGDARQKDCSLRAAPSDIPQPVETCDLPPAQDRLEPEATRRAGRKGVRGLYRVRGMKGVQTVRGAGLRRRPGEERRRTDIPGAGPTGAAELGRAWAQGPRPKGPLLARY